jgi:hypothetical protein
MAAQVMFAPPGDVRAAGRFCDDGSLPLYEGNKKTSLLDLRAKMET